MADGETPDGDATAADHDATRTDHRLAADEHDEPVGRSDPERDLQEFVTWEPRSRYDAICVELYRAYRLAVRAARAAILLVAVLVFSTPLILTVVVGLEEPVAGAFVLLSALPAFAMVGAIWYVGDPVREPLGPLVVTFLLGTLAAGLAGIVSGLADAVLLLGPLVAVLVAPPVEAWAKLAAVRLYAYRSPQFNAVIDGAVYGAVAGLGSAVTENAGYVLFDPEVQLAALVRAFSAPGHVLYTALTGYYLARAVQPGVPRADPAEGALDRDRDPRRLQRRRNDRGSVGARPGRDRAGRPRAEAPAVPGGLSGGLRRRAHASDRRFSSGRRAGGDGRAVIGALGTIRGDARAQADSGTDSSLAFARERSTTPGRAANSTST